MIERALKEQCFYGISGDKYKIDLSYINLARAPHFERLSIALAHRMMFQQVLERIDNVANILSKPMETNQIIGANRDALEEVRNLQKGLNEFGKNPAPPVVQFCAIFCVKEDEDIQFTNELVQAKAKDWGHIPMVFFYQLSSTIARAYSQNKISALSAEDLTEIGTQSPPKNT